MEISLTPPKLNLMFFLHYDEKKRIVRMEDPAIHDGDFRAVGMAS